MFLEDALPTIGSLAFTTEDAIKFLFTRDTASITFMIDGHTWVINDNHTRIQLEANIGEALGELRVTQANRNVSFPYRDITWCINSNMPDNHDFSLDIVIGTNDPKRGVSIVYLRVGYRFTLTRQQVDAIHGWLWLPFPS